MRGVDWCTCDRVPCSVDSEWCRLTCLQALLVPLASHSTCLAMSRRLTKSKFVLGCECATRLFYTGKSQLYPDNSTVDPFLAALAEGGMQVGALARCYFPDGTLVDTLVEADALEETRALLEREHVTIFEAAIVLENLLVRVDVLVKRGDLLELIEVKARSVGTGDASQFCTAAGAIKSDWKPYLLDVAFQKHVLVGALPNLRVTASLMLVDSTAKCWIDGMHQRYRVRKEPGGVTSVRVSSALSDEERASPLLRIVPVDELVDGLLEASNHGADGDQLFGDLVDQLSLNYARDEKIHVPIGSMCGDCSFGATGEQIAKGMKSGFEECWSRSLGWKAGDFEVPSVLEIGNFRRKDRLIRDGKASMLDVGIDDIGYDNVPGDAISAKERQWLQVRGVQTGRSSRELRVEPLVREMATWTYPLHFIDFETASPAIPLHAGCSPYGQLAFQFSHHAVFEDGRVAHIGQYIDSRVGAFPNFDFVRALKGELEKDDGTIFRYASHENTILAAIHSQLAGHASPPDDYPALLAFIESISHPSSSSLAPWPTPSRDMVDMCELVKNYYFDPAMAGSVSMKKVLPAVLQGSSYLRAKYSAPTYGSEKGAPSLNFVAQQWVELKADGTVRDPYALLPPPLEGLTPAQRSGFFGSDDELANGGAAMTAYTRMQFSEMPDLERCALRSALLRYCELDTLAMVMLYEAWREWVAGSCGSGLSG